MLLNNFAKIHYVAFGFMHEGVYEHIKVKHIRQNLDNEIEFNLGHLSYLIEKKGFGVKHFNINQVRIFVKGDPKENPLILVKELNIFNEDSQDFIIDADSGATLKSLLKYQDTFKQNINHQLSQILLKYDINCYPYFNITPLFSK